MHRKDRVLPDNVRLFGEYTQGHSKQNLSNKECHRMAKIYEWVMTSLKIAKKNEVHLTVDAEPHVQQELSDYFTFDVPGAKFMPQYRNRHWDGKIRLFSTATGEVYVGLLDKIVSWAKKSDYNVEFLDNETYGTPFEENEEISL